MRIFKRAAPPPIGDIAYPGGGTGIPPFPVGFLGQQSLDSWWQFVSQTVWTGDVFADELSALGVPAVSAALGLLAAYVNLMPLEAVRENTEPATVVASPPVIRNPLGDPRSTGLTFADWIDPLIRDLALWGNHLAILGSLSWTGWPQGMYPVGAGLWSVRWKEGGGREYTIGGESYDASEVFHIAINRRSGELVGRGLMNTNRDTLAAAIAAEKFAAKYFTYGTVPSVHIAHPNPDLTQAQADELKQKFLDSAKGTRAPVITPTGTDITVLPSDAESAQLVEARKWANASLAMALGFQPAMLGLEGPSMTYRNIAQVNQQTINTTVMRYLVPIEQQLTAQCLPAGTSARFNPAMLMRPDVGERITQALAAFTGGLVDVDEARAMLDLPPNEELAKTATPPADATQPADATTPALPPPKDILPLPERLQATA